MPILIPCPGCHTQHSLPDMLRGKRVRCKVCQRQFVVDAAAPSPAPPPAAPAGELTITVEEHPAAPAPAAAGVKVVQELIRLEDQPHAGAAAGAAPRLQPHENVLIPEQSRPATPPPLPARPAALPSKLPTAAKDAIAASPQATPAAAPSKPPVAIIHSEVRRRPRRRRGRDEYDEGPATAVGLIVGVVVVGVLLLTGAGALVWWLVSPSEPEVVMDGGGPVVVADPPPVFPGPQPPIDPPPVIQPPLFQPPIRQPPVFQPPVIRPQPPVKRPPPPWRPALDMTPVARVKPAAGGQAIAVPFGADVLFPTGPSAFAAVNRGPFNPGFDLWNLETMQKAGQFATEPGTAGPLVLSPDGRRLAGRVGTVIKVWPADGGPARTLRPAGDQPNWMEFAGPNRLVTLRHSGQGRIVDVWDLAAGRPALSMSRSGGYDPKGVALSPTGKYLAVVDRGEVSVQELRGGTRAPVLTLPPQQGAFAITGIKLAFSPDGTELGGLFSETFKGWRILSWELRRGHLRVDHRLPKDLGGDVRGAFFYKGAPLEWLPDRSGWLLYGQAVVDYKTGRTRGTLRPESDINPGRCHVLTPQAGARVYPLGGLQGAQVRIVELPRR